MAKFNSNISDLNKSYFFNEIEKKISKYNKDDLLNLGIGDITIPLPKIVIDSLKKAADDLLDENSLKGYGPNNGYDFLKKEIIDNDFNGFNFTLDEIFISPGAKYTLANISNLFSQDNIVGICDPTYPVYLDANIIDGRKNNIRFIPLLEENDFQPLPPKELLDIIYLCSPNNPIGNVIKKDVLKSWIDFAKKNSSIIIYDAAYQAFITSDLGYKSIYEIDGAKDVAIEIRSFSKTAGFTSLRCSYIAIPKELKIKDKEGFIKLNEKWERYISAKIGGVSYPIQKAAAATYSVEGKNRIMTIIKTYKENSLILRNGLEKLNFKVFGGIDAPFVFCKTKNNLSSWELFDVLLEKKIVTIPASGFGKCGEGFLRLSGFAKKDVIIKALKIMENV